MVATAGDTSADTMKITQDRAMSPPLDLKDGYLHLSDRPGLAIELDLDYIEAHPDPDWR